MSARFYPGGFSQIQDGTIDWTTANLKALLLSSQYTFNPAEDKRDNISDSYVIGTSSALTGATYANGLAGGDPFVWLQLSDTRVVDQIVIFDDSGDDPYSQLILHWDSTCLEGLPFTPQGEDYYLYPVTPPGGFFQITEDPVVGPINTYPLAGPYALAEAIGGDSVFIPCLYIGRDLRVRAKVCVRPDVSDSCCPPTITGDVCA